jgi:hypothetical protein
MKFTCGPTYQEMCAAKATWHDWFAWHPVRLGHTRDGRWLETIERREARPLGFRRPATFEYRAKEQK